MIMHAHHWYFRQRKILVCAAGSTWSVLAGVESGGKEARVATAPPDTATTRAGTYLLALPMFGWAGAGTAKIVVERQVHELGGGGFECVCFGGIPL